MKVTVQWQVFLRAIIGMVSIILGAVTGNPAILCFGAAMIVWGKLLDAYDSAERAEAEVAVAEPRDDQSLYAWAHKAAKGLPNEQAVRNVLKAYVRDPFGYGSYTLDFDVQEAMDSEPEPRITAEKIDGAQITTGTMEPGAVLYQVPQGGFSDRVRLATVAEGGPEVIVPAKRPRTPSELAAYADALTKAIREKQAIILEKGMMLRELRANYEAVYTDQAANPVAYIQTHRDPVEWDDEGACTF